MIAYLNGNIVLKKDKFIIVDVRGVGYKVFLSQKSLNKISLAGSAIKLFCFLNVQENALDLYGFLDYKEKEFFEILDSIRGVGPKAALEISSLGSLEEIKSKILSKDQDIFQGIPGIGKKKAMAIILELTGKIKEISRKPKPDNPADETEEALVGLGFSRQKVKEALKNISQDKTSEQKIQEALKLLGK